MLFEILKVIQVAILVDDMIDSGNTLAMAAKTLQENGVKTTYALVSHGMAMLILIVTCAD